MQLLRVKTLVISVTEHVQIHPRHTRSLERPFILVAVRCVAILRGLDVRCMT